MTFGNAIAQRLENICSEKGITINRLSIISGIRQSTINNIISGNTNNPKIKTLHRIAVGLNIIVSELLDFPEMNETQFEDE